MTPRLSLFIVTGLAAVAITTIAFAGPREDIVNATRLPEVADDLRQIGVPEADVVMMLDAAHGKGLGAGDAEDTLDSVKNTEKQGHLDNLGSFVKSQIEKGLRGKDLANAIHEEKQKKNAEQGEGLGKPEVAPGQAGDQGRSTEAHERNADKGQDKDQNKNEGNKGARGGKGSGQDHGKKGGK
jgi:hypothetical protein